MKNILSYTTVTIFLLYCFSGCTKNNTNPTQQISDQHAKYLGTWKGLVSDTLKSSSDSISLSIYRTGANNPLQGYAIYRNVIYRIAENIFFGGISYSVTNYDPQCRSSNLTLNTVITDTSHVLIYLWGDECNGLAIATTGTIPRTSSQPDLSGILLFGQNGHSWTWQVTNYDNSQCSYSYTMGKDFGNGVFRFSETNTCGWQNVSSVGYWYVTPQEWGNMTDSLVNHRFTMFRTDAVIGTVYKKIIAQDSVVNTVESLNDNITVNNQPYFCARIHTQQWHSGSKIVDGLAWINYQYGFVKFANLITTGALSKVHYEDLISKNF